MRRTTFATIALTGLLLACSSPSGPPADRIVYRTSDAPPPSIDVLSATGETEIPPMYDLTEGERIAWMQSHGVYPPFPGGHAPGPHDQSLGYVPPSSPWGWVVPALLTAGAIYGLYRVKRHNDW